MGIETCSSEDRPDQVQLFELCFGKDDGAAVLRWRYDENPHGRAIQLLAREERRAVAGYACNPRRALVRGEHAAIVGQTGDVMTDPDWRGKGIFSDLDRHAMGEAADASWPVVFGLPNRNSEKLFTQKLGWDLVGRIRPWTFVLLPGQAARRERLRAGRLPALGTPWARWRGTVARGRMRDRAVGMDIRAIQRFDGAVDGVWRTVAREFDWMVQRDADYLNWRFLDAPSGRFRAHGVFDPAGEMRGYAVVQLPDVPGSVGVVVDLLAMDEQAFAAAMDAALGDLAGAGACVARAWAIEGSWWQGRLVASGFRAPKRDDFKAVIAMVNDAEHPLARAAMTPARWYFTDGDRDDEVVN